jgi:lambda family phage portal protein
VARPNLAYKDRQRMRAAGSGGGYTGARIDRAALAAWGARIAGSPQSDIIADLPMLRARAADLERNSPVAAAIINTSGTHVVGTGLSCMPQIDADFLGLSDTQAEEWQRVARMRFGVWAKSSDCTMDRVLNFYGAQNLALCSTMSRGDSFVVTPLVQRMGRKRLALQLLEADRCSNPRNSRDIQTLTEGVECDASTGEAIAYHFTDRHPGDLNSGGKAMTWQRVAARGSSTGRRNVLHLYKQLRPGLRRGVPILAPVIEPIKQLTRYTDSELNAAVTSSLFSVFLKMDPKAFDDLFEQDAQEVIIDRAKRWSGEMESGQAVNLLPGEDVVTANPARPNEQFDPFVSACFAQIGMAVGIPKEVLCMHFQSSYSAARGALLVAWRFFMGWRDWLATYLCQPIYELWLEHEVAEGRIAAQGFFADEVVRAAWCGAQWVGDGPGSIDPEKDANAAEKRLAIGISTLEAESILHDGVDWETKHRQQQKEAKARSEAGMQVAGAAPPEPEPEEPDEEEEQSERQQREAMLSLIASLLTAAAQREPVAPVVHVEAPQITVTPPEVNVHVDGATIHVEPPPQPTAIETDVERAEDSGLITSKKQTFTY